MHLTREEERIYDGESGWPSQTCMRILVRLGELFGAKKLIPIESAHVSGVSYKTLGDAPIEFLETLARDGAKAKVKTTINPQSIDPTYLIKRLPRDIREKQSTILKQFDRMGVAASQTCTPYYLKAPRKNSHLAWAESSAVVYANSVLEARTNREGGPSALAAAIIGKTPDYGMHKTENRLPNVLVNVERPLLSETEFGALGIHLGKILGDGVPLIQGIRGASADDLKQLGAALAAAGMTNMFRKESVSAKPKGLQKIDVEARDITQTLGNLTTASTQEPDLVFIGCPHCSINEIKRVAQLSEDRAVKPNIECWICTSRYVKERTPKDVERIEGSGFHVLTDVCTAVSWTEKLGIKTIMTNSAKTAHYAPTLNKADTILAPLEDCLKTAFKG